MCALDKNHASKFNKNTENYSFENLKIHKEIFENLWEIKKGGSYEIF